MSKAHVEILRGDRSVTVVGTGEMDLSIGKQFDETLASAVASGESVTVDLTGADFIDSAIVQSLATHGKTVYDRQSRLKVLVISGAYPDYVLKTVGFAAFLDIEAEPGSG